MIDIELTVLSCCRLFPRHQSATSSIHPFLAEEQGPSTPMDENWPLAVSQSNHRRQPGCQSIGLLHFVGGGQPPDVIKSFWLRFFHRFDDKFGQPHA